MDTSQFEKRTILWTVIIAALVIVVGMSVFRRRDKKDFTPQEPPSSRGPPRERRAKRCMNSRRELVECGESTRIDVTGEMERDGKGVVVPQLKLINLGPVRIDVYYRDDDKTGELFVASLPASSSCGNIPKQNECYMYVQQIYDESGNARMMGAGGELFARFAENLSEGKSKKGDLLYIPYMLDGTETCLSFGSADSMTTHSRIVYNLMGEIMTIEFHNASNATYKLYYYGDCLGTLGPIGSGLDVMSSNNGNRGYRLNSKITLVMEGSNVKQELTINNLKMDTMIVGKIVSS